MLIRSLPALLLFAGTLGAQAPRLNPEALQRLLARAKETRSDALVVMKDGQILLNETFGTPEGPIETMSATKSVVSLAIGFLLDEGKLKSLDQPVADFYPEWKQGRKKLITLRHLLSHTSGLQNTLRTGEEIYPSPDFVRLALSAELSADPGSVFAYNNKAVNLLAGIVQRASGQRMDLYLKARLFTPLGITDFHWALDASGNPHGMAGLQLRPLDFAKIGQMLAEGGIWQGKRLLSAAWIAQSTAQPSQETDLGCGLLWWLEGGVIDLSPLVDDRDLASLRDAGLDPALLEKAARLKGRPMKDRVEAMALLRETFGPGGVEIWQKEFMARGIRAKQRRASPPTGFAAKGYRGQRLFIFPKDRLVVVRMHRERPEDENPDTGTAAEFVDLGDLISQLAKP